MRHLTILLVASLAFSALACGSGGDKVTGNSNACATGAEACPCFANSTCDAGVDCVGPASNHGIRLARHARHALTREAPRL